MGPAGLPARRVKGEWGGGRGPGGFQGQGVRGLAPGEAECPPGLVLITAITVPTGTVWSASTLISARVPLTGAGMSVSTLSVPISSNGSPSVTWSPADLCQTLTVPSSTVSPIRGMTTSVLI